MQYGDEREGFSVEASNGLVVVTAWGFWSPELAEQLVPAVSSALGSQRRGAALILEVGDLRPLREEAQAAFESLLGRAVSTARDTLIRAPSALTKLQMLRIARKIGQPGQIRVE